MSSLGGAESSTFARFFRSRSMRRYAFPITCQSGLSFRLLSKRLVLALKLWRATIVSQLDDSLRNLSQRDLTFRFPYSFFYAELGHLHRNPDHTVDKSKSGKRHVASKLAKDGRWQPEGLVDIIYAMRPIFDAFNQLLSPPI